MATDRNRYSVPEDWDDVLSSQWRRYGGALNVGERRLMIAVLSDAIDCYRKSSQIYLGERTAAEAWLFHDAGDGLFSFQNICFVLDLDPDWVRRHLANAQAVQVASY